VALSVQLLVTVSAASAQQQQPQYGEGPGVITQTLPTTGKGDVLQPIYGEGPGVIGSKLPNTGSGDVSQPSYGEGPGVVGSKLPNTGDSHQDMGALWGLAVLLIGVASGLFAIMWARGKRLVGRSGQRVMVLTRG
jgi:LPXTG-motif cell wall-anchored protein